MMHRLLLHNNRALVWKREQVSAIYRNIIHTSFFYGGARTSLRTCFFGTRAH